MATTKKQTAENARAERSGRELELERRVHQLEGRMHVQGVREARLERRSEEHAAREARRLLDRYGHQHGLEGIEPSDELVGMCAIGANGEASARARLEVHLHRRANNGLS